MGDPGVLQIEPACIKLDKVDLEIASSIVS